MSDSGQTWPSCFVFRYTVITFEPYAYFPMQKWILISVDLVYDLVTYFVVIGATTFNYIPHIHFDMPLKSVKVNLDFDRASTALKFELCHSFRGRIELWYQLSWILTLCLLCICYSQFYPCYLELLILRWAA